MLILKFSGIPDEISIDPFKETMCGERLDEFAGNNNIKKIEIKSDSKTWSDYAVREEVLLACAKVVMPNGTVICPAADNYPYFNTVEEGDVVALQDPLKPTVMKKDCELFFRGLQYTDSPVLYPHQDIAIKEWLKRGRRLLWGHDMGLGKTFSAGYLVYLNHLQKKYNRILVMSLASIIPKWEDMLRSWNLDPLVIDKNTDTLNIPDGTTVLLSTGRFRHLRAPKGASDLEKRVFNRKPLLERISPLFYPGQFDLIIFDESQGLNDINNLAYKMLTRIIKPETNLLFLSGTPFGNGYHEVFPQLSLLKPGLLPVRTQTDFYRVYCENVSRDPRYSSWRVIPERSPLLMEKIHEVSDFRRNIGIKLPPFREDDVPYSLSPEQKVFVKRITKNYMMPLDKSAPAWLTGMFPDGLPMTSLPMLRHLSRMVCSGTVKLKLWVPTMPEQYEERGYLLEMHLDSPKEKLLMDHLSCMGKDTQSIIWVSYTATTKKLYKLLQEKGFSCAQIYGGTGEKNKQRIIKEFLEGKHQHLISHPKCIGVGLDFVNATEHIFYEIPDSGIEYEQAKKRSHRIGQTRAVTIRRFYGKNSIEVSLLKNLNRKLEFIDELYFTGEIKHKKKYDIKWGIPD